MRRYRPGKKRFFGVKSREAYKEYTLKSILRRRIYLCRRTKAFKQSLLYKYRSLSVPDNQVPSHPHSIKSSKINHLRKQNLETIAMTAFKHAYKRKLSDSAGFVAKAFVIPGLNNFETTVHYC